MDAETVVRNFCEAFARQDLGELLAFFTEDAVYHNIPMAPAEGIDAIESTLKIFVDPNGEASFEIRNLAANGNVVLTERLDRLTFAGKQIEIPVMGAFEVAPDGRIRAWRDYFNMAQITQQTA